MKSFPVRLLLGIVVGISAGLVLPEQAMVIVVTIKYFLNQLINYLTARLKETGQIILMPSAPEDQPRRFPKPEG